MSFSKVGRLVRDLVLRFAAIIVMLIGIALVCVLASLPYLLRRTAAELRRIENSIECERLTDEVITIDRDMILVPDDHDVHNLLMENKKARLITKINEICEP